MRRKVSNNTLKRLAAILIGYVWLAIIVAGYIAVSVWLAGCAGSARQPEVIYYAPGSGAEVFTAPQSSWPGAVPPGRATFLPDGKDVVIPLRYPLLNLSNYWWDLQGSKDLVHWVTLQTNAGPGDVWVTNAGGFQAFRMHGHL